MLDKRCRIPKSEGNTIPPEPEKKRIPVRLDSRTVIMVPEGADVEAHIRRFRDRYKEAPIARGGNHRGE